MQPVGKFDAAAPDPEVNIGNHEQWGGSIEHAAHGVFCGACLDHLEAMLLQEFCNQIAYHNVIFDKKKLHVVHLN